MSAIKTVSDRLWIWGHPEDSFNEELNMIPQPPVTPAEGMRELNARNIFFVPFGHPMNMDAYSKDTGGITHAGLSVDNWGDAGADPLEKTLALRPMFPQVDRLVFDDFFCPEPAAHIRHWVDYSVEELIAERERIHAAGLEMWLVLYQMQLEANMDIDAYINVFDGVTFWFWDEPSVEQYHTYSEIFIGKTPGKKRMLGCYLFNFSKTKEVRPDMVRYQLDHNLELMRQGKLEGIVLHNNALGGFPYPAYQVAKEWAAEHGSESF